MWNQVRYLRLNSPSITSKITVATGEADKSDVELASGRRRGYPVKYRLPFDRRTIYDGAVSRSSSEGPGRAGQDPASPLGGLGRYAGPATLILSSLADGPKHGYALTKDIEQFAGLRLAPGTLYEALSRLEGQGLIEALE